MNTEDRVWLNRINIFKSEIVHLFARNNIPRQLANNAQLDAYIAYNVENLILTIKTWCISGRVDDIIEEEIVSYPDGTWETFKYHHMPKWFINRYPIKFVTKIIEKSRHIYFMCPHIDIGSIDNYRAHLEFMITGYKKS